MESCVLLLCGQGDPGRAGYCQYSVHRGLSVEAPVTRDVCCTARNVVSGPVTTDHHVAEQS